jgi:hypothetical protein
MDMFGIAPDEVRGVVTRAGGAVVNVEGDSLAGSEWTSHRYYVRRAGPG